MLYLGLYLSDMQILLMSLHYNVKYEKRQLRELFPFYGDK
jgi:hypothetical protein